ncbi:MULTISPECIES: hypothetical protein [unclassified Nocardia]|uniref:hypothetical protein n=1 Tax=unclassified Nocardia TaxID=2637762 RepID=UPI0033BFAC79
MRITHLTAVSAVLIGALAAGTGTAHAAPPEELGVVHYTTTTTDTNTLIQIDAGSLVVEDGALKVKAPDGKVLAGTELRFRVDEFVFPIEAEITERTATLTPQFTLDKAQYQPVALPYEDQATWKNDYDREKDAWSRMTSTIGLGASIGAMVGGIGGAAVGCVIGGATGASLTGALATMFSGLPADVQGCIAGVAAGGFLGVLAGQLLIAAPVAIFAAAQYFTTINQPSVQSGQQQKSEPQAK